MKQGIYTIIDKKILSKTSFSITIYCEDITEISKVGQFVHVKVDGFILRRPISICDINKENGSIVLAVDVIGDGTKKIGELHINDAIDIIGPIGKGFTLYENKKALIVGGGIGIAPLFPIAKYYGENSTTILGFRGFNNIILADEFKSTNTNCIITTDDGSVGIKGNVLSSVKDIIKDGDTDIVYTCGPHNMMKAIAEICHQHNVDCQVSLEERMGCGIGACLVCACSATINGDEKMVHICKDGPVFNSKEVF